MDRMEDSGSFGRSSILRGATKSGLYSLAVLPTLLFTGNIHWMFPLSFTTSLFGSQCRQLLQP